jgi:glycosyltransferase involved in cell wall biosynthesis
VPEAPSISVVIPAFNESESLVDTVAAVLAALPEPSRAQLVLVNDGSSDTTMAVMRSIEADCAARVLVVDRSVNGGMGQALASGFEVATGDVLTWIPGDGEYDLTEVLVGLPLLDTSDVVLVRRNSRGQFGRNIVSSVMYGLIRVLFGFNASGYCGIFVISQQRWHELAVSSRDVFFTLEVALRSRHARWNISFVNAEWRPRRAGRSKVFNVRTILRNVGELFSFRYKLWRGH